MNQRHEKYVNVNIFRMSLLWITEAFVLKTSVKQDYLLPSPLFLFCEDCMVYERNNKEKLRVISWTSMMETIEDLNSENDIAMLVSQMLPGHARQNRRSSNNNWQTDRFLHQCRQGELKYQIQPSYQQ